MDDAFYRLTFVQQISVNKAMFITAYNIIVSSNGDLTKAVIQYATDSGQTHLTADLLRYCRLV